MRIFPAIAAVWFTLNAFATQSGHAAAARKAAARKAAAERFFRGVYGGDPTVVDALASADILISYPIFESVLGKPAIRGREAVKAFVISFSQRWADPQIAIHAAIAEGKTVVLLWSYQARRVGSGGNDQPPTGTDHSWGGISLFHFDEDGKIAAEIGEESSPGPASRWERPSTICGTTW